jgi:prefoldin subunit 5
MQAKYETAMAELTKKVEKLKGKKKDLKEKVEKKEKDIKKLSQKMMD